jgi:hypothetical protein
MSENANKWGSAALGRHGNIEIDLDQPVADDGPWRLQISGRDWQFAFDVPGAKSARELSAFVKQHAGRNVFAEHRTGSFQAADVVVVKDSELEDRFWLRIRGEGQLAEITIHGQDAAAFQKALEDLVSDLAK